MNGFLVPRSIAQSMPRKPMAIARRVSFFEREVLTRLSSAAIEVLFDMASVLSEGQIIDGHYYGSTMVTFDAERARDVISDASESSARRDLAELMRDDPRVRDQARLLANREASRLAGRAITATQIDIRVRLATENLHLDIDVEGDAEHIND